MTTLEVPRHAAPPATASALDAAYSRITWRIIPFIFVIWVLAWIDRVNVGFVKLTMLDELAWSDAVYGLGAGIFFLGYFFFEVPSNMLLQKIGAKKTIMRITICWGIICMLQTTVSTPTQFYLLRFLLGAFEAGFYPGVILYLTYWYPSQRRARAFGTFMSASAYAMVRPSATSTPARTAPPLPWFCASRSTRTPAASATAAVSSRLPSSTIRISHV